ncbi:MAG: hypothetical protein HYZ53_01810 [Planctomycetes bacterium]|nr:hypothetical protein [Planctomycetota bacterium]
MSASGRVAARTELVFGGSSVPISGELTSMWKVREADACRPARSVAWTENVCVEPGSK